MAEATKCLVHSDDPKGNGCLQKDNHTMFQIKVNHLWDLMCALFNTGKAKTRLPLDYRFNK